MTRAEFVAQARTYLGVKFKHQGRSRQGLDCWGLPKVVAADFGIELPENRTYPRRPPNDLMVSTLNQSLTRIPNSEARDGDLVIFALGSAAIHCGILTDRGVIHANGGVGKVVEHGLIPSWRRRIVATYQIPGVD